MALPLPVLVLLLTGTTVIAADEHAFLSHVPPTAATVDRRVITRKRLGDDMLRRHQAVYYRELAPEMLDFEITAAIGRLIDQLLLDKAVAAEKITVTPDEIIRRAHDLYRQMSPQQKQMLHDRLRRDNIDLDTYARRAAADPDTVRALQLRKLAETVFPGRLNVSDAACEEYYRSHQTAFITPEAVEISHILLVVRRPEHGNAAQLAAREKKAADRAAAAFAELKQGRPFAAVARQYSDCPSAAAGGNLGRFIRRGGLDPEPEKAVFTLPEGGVSGILRTSAGYEIYRVNRVIPEGYSPFEEVKDLIREQLQTDLVARLTARIVAREKRRSRIVINYRPGGNIKP